MENKAVTPSVQRTIKKLIIANSVVSIVFIPFLLPMLTLIKSTNGLWIIVGLATIVYATVIHCYVGKKIWNAWGMIRWSTLCFIYGCLFKLLVIPPRMLGFRESPAITVFALLDSLQKLVIHRPYSLVSLVLTIFIFVQIPSLLTYFIWLFIEKFIT